MPYAPPRHNAGRVAESRKVQQREYNRTKRTGQEFYKTPAWKRLRASYAKRHPLCVRCRDQGIARTLDVVDHIVPVKENGSPLCESNLQSMCNYHHNQKSAADRVKYGS